MGTPAEDKPAVVPETNNDTPTPKEPSPELQAAADKERGEERISESKRMGQLLAHALMGGAGAGRVAPLSDGQIKLVRACKADRPNIRDLRKVVAETCGVSSANNEAVLMHLTSLCDEYDHADLVTVVDMLIQDSAVLDSLVEFETPAMSAVDVIIAILVYAVRHQPVSNIPGYCAEGEEPNPFVRLVTSNLMAGFNTPDLDPEAGEEPTPTPGGDIGCGDPCCSGSPLEESATNQQGSDPQPEDEVDPQKLAPAQAPPPEVEPEAGEPKPEA